MVALLTCALSSAAQTHVGTPGSKAKVVADAAFFERSVRPLLEKNCLGCHGVGNRLSGLDLRSRESALKGGTRGAAIVPGHSEKSLLYKLITGLRAPSMPPGGSLLASDIRTLKTWLDGGAPWSGAVANARKQVWWSFKTPVLPKPPYANSSPDGNPSSVTNAIVTNAIVTNAIVTNAIVTNAIDAFVLTKLKAAHLSPSPPAPKRVLIRRAYLDLIGLPPTPEEVHAFVADRAPNAWEKVVDRLLASPRYGERWGRHWLDLVRYADSGGFEGDMDRPLAWRYRDYVIDAFDRDKPYDQFISEQIAGDELRPGDPEATIATGYLACGPQDQVEMNARTRSNEMDDLVSTTGAVVLGLTVGCARCHDHKYDPITQVDYYRMSALFAPTVRRDIEIPTPEERARIDAWNAGIEKELAPLHGQAAPLRAKGEAAAKKAGQEKPTDEQILAALPEPERKQLSAIQEAIQKVEAKRMAPPLAMAVTDTGRDVPPAHLLIRGDAYHPGDEVQPGFIRMLPGGEATVSTAAVDARTTGRRRALAAWLVSRQNPLTARVWMNRVWRQHFGHGLVDTPSNFGISGELPSHPELLDWLAVTFMRSGWRLKPMHRLMLLSATYQQASDIRATAMAADPQNRLYWRMPLRRLEAEAIRDSLLDVAGTLNLQRGGPPIYPPIDPSLRADTFKGPNWQDGKDDASTWRRSVYVKVKRSLILPELDVFDCPEITYTVAQRNVTTTPLQALMLLNDPFILRQSTLFAGRIKRECGNDMRKQIDRTLQLALCRPPTDREMKMSLAFLKTRGPNALTDFCHAIFNLNEFVYAP